MKALVEICLYKPSRMNRTHKFQILIFSPLIFFEIFNIQLHFLIGFELSSPRAFHSRAERLLTLSGSKVSIRIRYAASARTRVKQKRFPYSTFPSNKLMSPAPRRGREGLTLRPLDGWRRGNPGRRLAPVSPFPPQVVQRSGRAAAA